MSREKTIREQIEFLKILQIVDEKIYALNKEKAGMPERIKHIDDALEGEKLGLSQAEANLKSLQVKLKDKEISLQQKEEQIKKLEIQLYQLKNNKEYSAMLSEIGGIKADNSLIEEEVIRLMDEIELGKKKITDERDLFKKEEIKSKEEKNIIDLRRNDIEKALSELSKERENIVPNIDKDILLRYERVLKNREGLAVVPIEGGSCGGCHMNLPPQVVSDAKLKEDIVVCGVCSRILYIGDNVEIN